eukprot:scaffold549_cov385-Prasinococcus_capsulatus_cf.AAC.4
MLIETGAQPDASRLRARAARSRTQQPQARRSVGEARGTAGKRASAAGAPLVPQAIGRPQLFRPSQSRDAHHLMMGGASTLPRGSKHRSRPRGVWLVGPRGGASERALVTRTRKATVAWQAPHQARQAKPTAARRFAAPPFRGSREVLAACAARSELREGAQRGHDHQWAYLVRPGEARRGETGQGVPAERGGPRIDGSGLSRHDGFSIGRPRAPPRPRPAPGQRRHRPAETLHDHGLDPMDRGRPRPTLTRTPPPPGCCWHGQSARAWAVGRRAGAGGGACRSRAPASQPAGKLACPPPAARPARSWRRGGGRTGRSLLLRAPGRAARPSGTLYQSQLANRRSTRGTIVDSGPSSHGRLSRHDAEATSSPKDTVEAVERLWP